jgi:hypothetical protein
MPLPEYQRLLGLLLHDHGQHVRRVIVGVDAIGDVEAEPRVAVRVIAQQLPVQIHVGVHVDAVEIEADRLAGHRPRQGERLAVPAEPAGEVPGGIALGGRGLLLDAPVVRQGARSPRRVVEARCRRQRIGGVAVAPGRVGGVGRVHQLKLPAVIEIQCPAVLVEHPVGRVGRHCGGGRHGGRGRQHGCSSGDDDICWIQGSDVRLGLTRSATARTNEPAELGSPWLLPHRCWRSACIW